MLGVCLGVALVVAVGLGRTSAVDSFIAMIDDMAGRAVLQVTAEANGGFSAEKLKVVRSVKGVAAAAGSINRVIAVRPRGASIQEAPETLQFLAVDPKLDKQIRRYRLSAGRWPDEKRREVMLTAAFADRKSISLNGRIELLAAEGPIEATVVGLLDDTGVGRTAQGSILIAPLTLGRSIYRLNDKLTTVDLAMSKGQSVGTVKRRIKAAVGPELKVEEPRARGAAFNSMITFLMSALDSLSMMVLLAGAFIIFGTIRMNVEEQERQIGTLRSVGATRIQVFLIALFQGVFLGAAGSLAGVWFGGWLASGLLKTVETSLQLGPTARSAVWGPGLLALGGGIFMSVLATLSPAWRASRLAPIATLSGAKEPGRHRFEKPWLVVPILALMAGTILMFKPTSIETFNGYVLILVLGVIIVSSWLVGVAGGPIGWISRWFIGRDALIAGRNLSRGRSQTAPALAIVVLSLVVTLMSGELVASDRQFFNRIVSAVLPFDIVVGAAPYTVFSANQHPSMDSGMTGRIEAVSGVARVDAARFLSVRALDMDLYGIFVDTSREPPTGYQTNGIPAKQAHRLLNKGHNVILGSAVAKKKNIKIGQYLTVKTPVGPRRFKVVATIHHPGNNGETITFSRRDQQRYWRDKSVDYYQILVDKGVSIETVKRRLIAKVGRPYGVNVSSSEQERAAVMESVNKFLATYDSMALMAALISALAVINAQTMNILARQREIGVMRAVGASRWQIRRLVVWEAAFLGLTALVVGLIIGMPVSHSVIVVGQEITGWPLEYVWPRVSLYAAVFIALGLTVLASLYPAERAARLNIVASLRR